MPNIAASNQANYALPSPYQIIQSASRVLVATLAITSSFTGAGNLAHARRLNTTPTQFNTSTNSSQIDLPTNPNPNPNSINPKNPKLLQHQKTRAECQDALNKTLAAAQKGKKDYPKRTTLAGLNPDKKPIRKELKSYKKSRISAQSDNSDKYERVYENIKVYSKILGCSDILKLVQERFFAQGPHWTSNEVVYNRYRQAIGEEVMRRIKEQNLTIDGHSLLLQRATYGKNWRESLVLVTDQRRRGQKPRIAVLTDEKCRAVVLHPMIRTVPAGEACGYSIF
jgi:hypothetical protein